MNLIVTGHHVDVTSSMRNYVTEKMERLQRHSENLFGIHVILSVSVFVRVVYRTCWRIRGASTEKSS